MVPWSKNFSDTSTLIANIRNQTQLIQVLTERIKAEMSIGGYGSMFDIGFESAEIMHLAASNLPNLN